MGMMTFSCGTAQQSSYYLFLFQSTNTMLEAYHLLSMPTERRSDGVQANVGETNGWIRHGQPGPQQP